MTVFVVVCVIDQANMAWSHQQKILEVQRATGALYRQIEDLEFAF
jgi:hypothetical protein